MFTVSATDRDGGTATSSVGYIVAARPPPPIVTHAAQTYDIWREGGKLATFARTHHPKPPVGTRFSFTLNEQARVSFTFRQQVGGRIVNGKCVARSTKNRARQACKLTPIRGMLSFTGHAGTDDVGFQGRVRPRQKLPPGRYTLIIVATNTAGQRSHPRQLAFTIVT